MIPTNEAPPAFPWCGDLNECPTKNLGMTLRDYFAAKAMESLVADRLLIGKYANSIGVEISLAIAQLSYDYADAMLAARSV